MNINRTINTAAYAGKILLESGAEINRVEETITRICKSCSITKVDVYATVNVIIVSVEDRKGNTISVVKRTKRGSQNLEKISQVNNISRHIKDFGYTIEDVWEELMNIDKLEPYNYTINVLFSGGASGFFCLVFNGNVRDFIVSFIIGCLIKVVSSIFNYIQSNEFFINIICGAIVAFIALTSARLNSFVHADIVIKGSIMVLVPGVAITNAIRDTIAGDLLSGVLGGVEAFLVAVAIAVGTGIVMRLFFITGGFNL